MKKKLIVTGYSNAIAPANRSLLCHKPGLGDAYRYNIQTFGP
jgi:hypothetical protein